MGERSRSPPAMGYSSSISVTQSCLTLCNPMGCSTPGFLVLSPRACSNSRLFSQWCHPTISSSVVPLSSPLQSFPASGSFQMSPHQVAKVLELSISLSNEYSGLISFRIDWFDLLAVQGTLKSLLQHHSSKASILRCLAFFTVQPTLTSIHDYWKNHSFD